MLTGVTGRAGKRWRCRRPPARQEAPRKWPDWPPGACDDPLERARQRLQSLGLKQLAEVLGTTLYAEANRRLTCPEMPAHPEVFNPGFQPSIDERQVWQLACRAFRGRGRQHTAAGAARRGPDPPGVARAIREAVTGPYSVRACDLMEDLRRARTEHNLDRTDAPLSGLQAAGGGRIRHPALRPGLYTTTALFTLDLGPLRLP